MRQRDERRLAKQIRRLRPGLSQLPELLRQAKGKPVAGLLRKAALDPEEDWLVRGEAARVLASVDARGITSDLLRLFFAQAGQAELWQTALTLEALGSRAAVSPLVNALRDGNPHRRHAAARALGWIPNAGRTAAAALTAVLADPSQPQPVREEAAESLAYVGDARSISALIAVLDEPDVKIRFWAVFALGSLGHRNVDDGRIVQALERMLQDTEVPAGNWWPVGREALAMLAGFQPEYRVVLQTDIAAVLANAEASPEDRRWAEAYSEPAEAGGTRLQSAHHKS